MFKDGLISSPKVKVKRYNSIEHGQISKITSVVLHRTAGSSASASLNAYAAGQSTGAHFLIDREGGIYQTASLNERCWHVGKLYSRCKNEGACSPDELKRLLRYYMRQGFHSLNEQPTYHAMK